MEISKRHQTYIIHQLCFYSMYENYILLVVIFAKCTVKSTVCTVNMHQSTVKHSQYAQSVLCVPVPDHMLCYSFHVIGYWRKSKPTLPKFAIQNAV